MDRWRSGPWTHSRDALVSRASIHQGTCSIVPRRKISFDLEPGSRVYWTGAESRDLATSGSRPRTCRDTPPAVGVSGERNSQQRIDRREGGE